MNHFAQIGTKEELRHVDGDISGRRKRKKIFSLSTMSQFVAFVGNEEGTTACGS